nr:hypothetical protein [Spongiactinospora gelatinilytica]
MDATGCCDDGGHAGRVPERRVGGHQPGDDQADGRRREQDRPPGRAALASQGMANADGEGDQQQPAQDEVDRLEPGTFTGAELADTVTPQAVPRPGGTVAPQQNRNQNPGDGAPGDRRESCRSGT